MSGVDSYTDGLSAALTVAQGMQQVLSEAK